METLSVQNLKESARSNHNMSEMKDQSALEV